MHKYSLTEMSFRQINVENIKSGGYFNIKLADSLDPFYVRKIPVWKRAMDIVGAIVGLILSAPIFLILPLIIKSISPGPVFFRQERVGYGGRRFTFIKFRTMVMDADPSQHKQYYAELIKSCKNASDLEKCMLKLDNNNSQIIPFGKMLRKACLDELPQLFNVLRGDMSLVGPRPPIPYEVDEYSRWHNGRFDAVPGMTGLWQVSGKNRLTFKEMVRLDIRYARQLSLWLDLKILLKTPFAVCSQVKDDFPKKPQA